MAELTKEQQLQYNLTILKRRDAAISGVVDMAGHVVIYKFSEETQAWDRRNVEGSLFVVSRTGDPKYMFVVLNRISSENVVESVTTEFQMELTEQFLLYRNDTQEINGIWFYSSTERSAISELLQSIVAGAQPAAMAAPSEAPRPAPSAADVPAPGDSVANFFAAAAGGGTMPPMPQVPASAGESAAAAPPPTAAKQPKAAAKPEPPPPAAASDTAALKAQLRAKLSALINDDTFMDVLVQEYQQQQAAGGGAAAAANGGAAAAAAPAEGEVPAHLQALFKQMQT